MLDDKLSEIPVFLNLEKQQLYELNTWLTRSDFPAGATILKEGEPSVGLYVLIKGDVDVLENQLTTFDSTIFECGIEGKWN